MLDQEPDGGRLLRRVTPLDVERRLDAGADQQRRTGLLGDLLRRQVDQTRRTRQNLARCVGEQVERIFDAPCSLQGPRIDCDSQRLGELLPIERGRLTSQLDGALEQAAIHLMSDESLAERWQRALRKRRVVLPEHAQNHLPSRIDHRQLHGLGVGRARVRLQKNGHRKQRGRDRRLALTRGPVHLLKLRLKGIVEQLVPVQPQESEQLARTRHPANQVLLASRQRGTRIPTRHG